MNLTKDTIINNLTPTEFYLGQNYPNPFNERTTIKFCMAYKTKVKLEVFNHECEMIEILLDEEKEAGTYEVEFYPASSILQPASGIYIYQLRAGEFLSRKRMTLLR